jgi:hypothetical protein
MARPRRNPALPKSVKLTTGPSAKGIMPNANHRLALYTAWHKGNAYYSRANTYGRMFHLMIRDLQDAGFLTPDNKITQKGIDVLNAPPLD